MAGGASSLLNRKKNTGEKKRKRNELTECVKIEGNVIGEKRGIRSIGMTMGQYANRIAFKQKS